MGGGRSGNGGGRRDNRNWGGVGNLTREGMLDGYHMYDSKEEIEDALGEDAQKWKDSLTPAEEVAVEWYTGNGHRPLNEFERNGIQSKSYSVEQLMEASDNLESALSKGHLGEKMVVNRTSSADLLDGASTVAEIRKKFGEVVTDKGFTSSEISLKTSIDNPYDAKQGEKQIRYHIKVPAGDGIGQYVQPIANAQNEREFLFNRGSSYKIVGAYNDAQGQVHVNLRYVGRNVK